MAINVFLQLKGPNGYVKGECKEKDHGGNIWTQINSYHFDISNPVTVGSDVGGTTGKALPSGFFVSKKTDIATTILASSVAQGTMYDSMMVQVCHVKDKKTVVLIQYDFQEVLVSQINWNASAHDDSDRPLEMVNFVFAKLNWSYTPIKADGTAGTKIGPKGWDFTTNTKL